MLRGFLKRLRSLRFTIFLFLCLAATFFLSLIVPQRDLLGKEAYLAWKATKPGLVSFLQYLGLTDIFTSPVTLVLWMLFFLNLLLIMANRLPVTWKRCFKREIPQSLESVQRGSSYEPVQAKGADEVVGLLKKAGYKAYFRQGDHAFHAVKNRFAPLATVFFHLSFILILVGGVTSFYTKFRAEADVAVGETFMGNYRWRVPPKIGRIPSVVFTVTYIKPTYFNKTLPVDLKVEIVTSRGINAIGINKPYKEGPLSLIIQDIDVAPLFLIMDAKGKEIDGAYVRLKVLAGKEDSFEMQGYKFEAFFNVDVLASASGAARQDAGQSSEGFAPREQATSEQKEIVNPGFDIKVKKGNVQVAAGKLRLGESLDFEGMKLVFSDLTYWANFYVVKEHGLPLVYAGFLIIVLALTVRFVFYRRDIRGYYEDGVLHIGGRAEFYPALFKEELKRLAAKTEDKAALGDEG